MPTEDQFRRYAKLIGIVYGVLAAMELYHHPITYAALERIMDEQQHCSPMELRDVCKELHRFHALVEQAEKQVGK